MDHSQDNRFAVFDPIIDGERKRPSQSSTDVAVDDGIRFRPAVNLEENLAGGSEKVFTQARATLFIESSRLRKVVLGFRSDDQ
jgi:hypothetical protein